VHGLGEIYGMQVGGEVAGEGSVGVFTRGRRLTEENLAGARKWILEIDSNDIRWLSPREVVDEGSGQVYEVLGFDALSAENPGAACDLFFADSDGGVLRFLRRSGVTVAELEERAVEADRARQKRTVELQRWRGKQRLAVLSLEDLHPGVFPTLRQAALEIHECGGTVELGENGSIMVSVPQQLHQLEPGDFGSAIIERETRLRLARCGQSLAAGRSVVVAALELDGSKSLPDRLPDRVANLGEA
jgi:hypothetical protein